MYSRNLEKLIPIVVNIIEHKINLYDEEKDAEEKKELCHITKKFNGYFASFGPSVLMAGLYQTIFFYDDKHKCINDIIFEAMQKMGWIDTNHTELKHIVRKDNSDLMAKKHVLEVIVACKLAIRTFALEEE